MRNITCLMALALTSQILTAPDAWSQNSDAVQLAETESSKRADTGETDVELSNLSNRSVSSDVIAERLRRAEDLSLEVGLQLAGNIARSRAIKAHLVPEQSKLKDRQARLAQIYEVRHNAFAEEIHHLGEVLKRAQALSKTGDTTSEEVKKVEIEFVRANGELAVIQAEQEQDFLISPVLDRLTQMLVETEIEFAGLEGKKKHLEERRERLHTELREATGLARQIQEVEAQ